MSYNGSRGPPAIEGMTSLKVDNLTYRTNVEDLKRIFNKYGEVGDVYIPRRKDGESRGFAFVRYYEKRDAEDAMDSLDGTTLDGREIRVQSAKYGRPIYDPRRRGGSRGRYDDYGSRRNRGSRRRSRSRSRSPRRRSPRRRRSHSRSRSPPYQRRRSSSPRQSSRRSNSPAQRRQSRSPQQTSRRSTSRSPRRQRSNSGSPKRRSQSPAPSASPPKERSKSPSPDHDDQ